MEEWDNAPVFQRHSLSDKTENVHVLQPEQETDDIHASLPDIHSGN